MIMKIISAALVALVSIFGCSSCSAKNAGDTDTSNNSINLNDKTKMPQNNTPSADSKKLVVFFSHTGENYNVGVIEKGNTHIIADMIADGTGADIFEIKPVTPYPFDYNECIDKAKKEKQAGARPAVNGDVAIEDYDVIFLGYPNWWGEVPMCVYTFIEKHNWNGKTVIPFITHEGSGMGGTDRKIAAACKGSDTAVGRGLAIQGAVAQNQQDSARRSVDAWLGKLGYSKK